jgi:hypothetical protein
MNFESPWRELPAVMRAERVPQRLERKLRQATGQAQRCW